MIRKLFPGISLEERMAQTDWRPSGFDYMRIALALAVILAHTKLITYGKESEGPFVLEVIEFFARMIVPSFFALSGFLVAGSLERSKTLVNFLGLRIFRIMPALSMEVLLSALILGPLLTTLTLNEYFQHPEFHRYFLNIIGEIHYYLPGVFKENPFDQVNGQLWTVPYELVCYVILSLFAVFGIFRNRKWLLVMVGVYHLGQVGNSIMRPHEGLMTAAGSTVVMCFITGLLVYRYREEIVWSGRLCLAMFAFSLLLLSVPNGVRFCALPLTYVTVYLGLTNPPRNKALLSGDYSYGVYLYGFPIQQAVFAMSAPEWREWYMNFLISAPLAMLMAVFSWWVVEKPVLAQKGILKKLEAKYLSWPPAQKFRALLERFFGPGDIAPKDIPTFETRKL
jgi:peptidoglycan/LPS O-acetylase OafA/YrhL